MNQLKWWWKVVKWRRKGTEPPTGQEAWTRARENIWWEGKKVGRKMKITLSVEIICTVLISRTIIKEYKRGKKLPRELVRESRNFDFILRKFIFCNPDRFVLKSIMYHNFTETNKHEFYHTCWKDLYLKVDSTITLSSTFPIENIV